MLDWKRPPLMLFNVTPFAEFRLPTIREIEASDQQAALEQAVSKIDDAAINSAEYAEGFTNFLVDEIGDDQYRNSSWFREHTSVDNIVSLLQSFVAWRSRNQHVDSEFDRLIDQAVGILRHVTPPVPEQFLKYK